MRLWPSLKKAMTFRARATAAGVWLENAVKNRLIGILVFTLISGLAVNFIYDAVKPKDQPPPPVQAEPDQQLRAQALRTSASSMRSITAMHMRNPPPKRWEEAEAQFAEGARQYQAQSYGAAAEAYRRAFSLYSDLREEALAEGH